MCPPIDALAPTGYPPLVRTEDATRTKLRFAVRGGWQGNTLGPLPRRLETPIVSASDTHVAVIMAVYDGVEAEHLEEALQSLADQTRRPEEVVVAEDGPLPSALTSVLESFSDPVLPMRRVAIPSRSGSGPARQAALMAATADLIAIADADDISLPTRLERQLAVFMDPEVDVLGTAMEEFDAATGMVLGVRRFPADHDDIVGAMRSTNPVNQPTVMMRRSALEHAGGYRRLPMLEDYDLWARMASTGARLRNLDEVLVRFRGGRIAQRRRRSAEAMRAEWRLQQNLRAYGLIGRARMGVNIVFRTAYRLAPVTLADWSYRRVLLTGPETDSRPDSGRPEYDRYRDMSAERGPLAQLLARQVLETTKPFLSRPPTALDVLDIGSGYGHTAAELARYCRSVTGIEPAEDLHEAALKLAARTGQSNLAFRHESVTEMAETRAYDVVVLDNVYEHLPDQKAALQSIVRALRTGGCLFIVVPNKLWPIEAHYGLPFLALLPLRLANVYLRLSGRGSNYEDASYAPTLWSLRRELRRQPMLEHHFVLPGDRKATIAGSPIHYRVGMALLARFPSLWGVSKAFVVVAVKR